MCRRASFGVRRARTVDQRRTNQPQPGDPGHRNGAWRCLPLPGLIPDGFGRGWAAARRLGRGWAAARRLGGGPAAAREVRVIVPTVYRNSYLAALRSATTNASFAPLVAPMRFAQRYTARIDFTSRGTAEPELARSNALLEPDEAEDNGLRLVLPDA